MTRPWNPRSRDAVVQAKEWLQGLACLAILAGGAPPRHTYCASRTGTPYLNPFLPFRPSLHACRLTLPCPALASPPPPQADPCLYTTDLESINTTLAVVAGDEFVDEFAVVATLRAVREGEQLLASPPVNPEDGGSSSHLHGHFGHLTHCAGNVADTVNLQPDVVG